MHADWKARRSDLSRLLRRALQSYDGDPRHVPVWIAHRHTGLTFNELRCHVADVEGLSGTPKAVSQMIGSVEEHLQDELGEHLTA